MGRLAILTFVLCGFLGSQPLAAQDAATQVDEKVAVADSLNNLAWLYYEQSRYGEAEPLYDRALTIYEAAHGLDHPWVASTLNNLALLYWEQGRYEEAEPLYERALSIKEAVYGPEHPSVATTLNGLALLYEEQGRYGEAEPLYERALSIYEAALGPNHPRVASTLNNLALLYAEQGRYGEAEPLYERVLSITEAAYGPDHPDVAATLNNLALLYREQGRYGEAEPQYDRALSIYEAVHGPDHPDVATTLNNLAWLYWEQGRHGEAESLYDRALTIREEAYGPEHPDVAATLSNLAVLYREQGRYGEAEPLYDRALSIYEAAYGPDHPAVAATLHNLAALYRGQGRYGEAEPLFERALSIREAALGPDHPEVAATLHNLALFYENQGRYGEAEPLYDRALSIYEAAHGPDHPAVAATLHNLAWLYYEQGRYGEAEPLYERVLSIREAAYGPDHPEVAATLSNLASLYLGQGRYGEAEPLYERVLSIYEATYGHDHADVAATLHNLALFYERQGRYGEAEPLYERALSIYEAAYGPDHPLVGTTLNSLAWLYYEQGRYGEAEPLYERAISILDRSPGAPSTRRMALSGQARLFHATDRPREAIDLLAEAIEAVENLRITFGGDEELQAGFLAKHADLYERMVRWQLESGEVEEALEFAERGRARVLLDQLAAGQIDIRDGIAPEIREPLEAREREARARLAEYQQRITLVRGREDLPQPERLARIEILTDSLKTADEDFRQVYREIKNASPLWQDILTRGGRPVALSTVQTEVVGRDGVLLLYELGDEESYLFVIPPGREDVEVVRLELGPDVAERLGVEAGVLSQGLVSELLNEGTRGALSLRSAPSGGGGGREARRGGTSGSEVSTRLLALREALVPDGVWERVRIAEEVVVIPDGTLYHLPFESLVTGVEDGEVRYWLDEAPPVRYGASLTVLANLERRRSTRPVGLTSRGGILSASDLIYNPLDVQEVTQEASEEEVLASSESVSRDSFERLGGSLAPLPGTAAETDSILSAFGADPVSGPVTVLSGAEGTESALRSSLGSFRYLHLATHGLVDEGRSSLFASLALTPPPGRSDESTNDGFLQLHEIYGLQLPELELAVLSACESNVGETVEGEGVFALSRGFLVAGAQRVIASQWAVNDASTAVLMATFFRQVAEAERRAEVVDYARALRTAQLAVKNHPDHPEWADPYYWAPFVLTGKR